MLTHHEETLQKTDAFLDELYEELEHMIGLDPERVQDLRRKIWAFQESYLKEE